MSQQGSRQDGFLAPIGYLAFAAMLLGVGLTMVGLGFGSTALAMIPPVMALAFGVILGRLSPRVGLTLVPWVLAFHSFLSLPGGASGGYLGLRLVIATKEIYLFGLFLGLLPAVPVRGRLHRYDYLGFLFALVYAWYFVISPAPFFSRAVSLREGWMVVGFYLCGRMAWEAGVVNRRDLHLWAGALIPVGLGVAAFGFLEYLAFDVEIWDTLGVFDYYENKMTGIIYMRVIRDLPPNWFTYLDGVPYRRMVGPMLDATSFSRFLSLPILVLWHQLRWRRMELSWSNPALVACSLVIGAAMVLSLGRGGMLVAALGALYLEYRHRPAIAPLLGAIVLFAMVLAGDLFDPTSATAQRHFTGAERGVTAALRNPWGYGLGTSGQLAVMYSDAVEEKVSESYLGALLYQSGIPGALTFYLFLGYLLWRGDRAVRRSLESRGEGLPHLELGVAALIGVTSTSLLGNSAIAPISSGPILLLVGLSIADPPEARGDEEEAETEADLEPWEEP